VFQWTGSAFSRAYLEFARGLHEGRSLLLGNDAMPQYNIQPLYPMVMATVMSVFQPAIDGGENPLKLMQLFLYLGSILLVYFFSRSYLRTPYPAVITILYTVTPMILLSSGNISADLIYLVISLAGLITMNVALANKGESATPFQLFMCSAWVVLAIYTRNIGWVLMLAFWLCAAPKLGVKRTSLMVMWMLLALSPWYLRELYVKNVDPTFYRQTAASVEFNQPQREQARFPSLKEAGQNARVVLWDMTYTLLGNLDMNQMDGGVLSRKLYLQRNLSFNLNRNVWLQYVVAGIIVVGIILGFVRSSGITSFYIILYLLAVCFLPVQKERYLIPVFPLVLLNIYWGMMGFSDLMKRLSMPIVGTIAIAIVTLAFGLNFMMTDFANVRAADDRGRLTYANEPVLMLAMGNGDQARDTIRPELRGVRGRLRAYRWVTLNTPPKSVIMTQNPTAATYVLQRPTLGFPEQADSQEALLTQLFKAQYVIEETDPMAADTGIPKLLRYHDASFQMVFQDPDANIKVWQVLGQPSQTEQSQQNRLASASL
jgi:hypothetical protein